MFAGIAMTVGQRCDQFLANLKLTADQREDGIIKYGGVRRTLNWYYYSSSSSSANSLLVGSWGKCTEIRPPRDIDVMFILPNSVYQRYEWVQGNKQSQLLQEVKRVLQADYPTTNMRADGQVVMVPFSTYAVEVAPAFAIAYSQQYRICDTNGGGKYKTVDPKAEIANVQASNDDTKGNTRDLIRMLKRWQEYCNVPMKSFWLELLAIEFLRTWQYKGNSTTYYDWMVRDFFTSLATKGKTIWNVISVPGTYETIWIGNDWASRAETARDRAVKATEYEAGNMPYSAGSEWQKIFGTDIPTG